MRIISSKKYFFILIITITVIIFQSSISYASLIENQKFGDWTMHCKNNEPSKDGELITKCSISQTLASRNEEKSKIASLKLRYSNDGILKLIEVLPFGIKIQSGSYIISGSNDPKPLASAEIVTCYDYGCIARIDLSQEDINSITNSDNNVLRLTAVDGQLVDIPFSNKGLKEALSELYKRSNVK